MPLLWRKKLDDLRGGVRAFSAAKTTTTAPSPSSKSWISPPSTPRFFVAGSYEYEISVLDDQSAAQDDSRDDDDPSPTATVNERASLGGGREEINSQSDRDGGARSDTGQSEKTSDNGPQVAAGKSAIQGRRIKIIERMLSEKPKTVYLIRHAESDENRRLASMKRSFLNLARFVLPERSDVVASTELLNVAAQIDSNVSETGSRQINFMAERLREDNFLEERDIELVVHSSLKRARQTCHGMLGVSAPVVDATTAAKTDEAEATNEDEAGGVETPAKEAAKLPHPVQRVVELPSLIERTPMEWLPYSHDAFTKRIAEFETWLGEQPETTIAVVGHSQFFKSMLGLKQKFGNCDVWQVQFDSTVRLSHTDVKATVRDANTKEAMEGLKRPFRKRQPDMSGSSGNAPANVDGTTQVVDSKREGQDPSKADAPSSSPDNEDEIPLPRGWSGLKSLYICSKIMDQHFAPVTEVRPTEETQDEKTSEKES